MNEIPNIVSALDIEKYSGYLNIPSNERSRIIDGLLSLGLKDSMSADYLRSKRPDIVKILNFLCLALLNARISGSSDDIGVLERAVGSVQSVLETL